MKRSPLRASMCQREMAGVDLTRIARILAPVTVGAGVMFSLLYIGVYFWLGRPWQWAWMVAAAVLTTVFYLIAYLLVLRGRLTAAVYLMAVGINLHTVMGPALVEGMIVPGIFTGLSGILFARLIAGRRTNRVVVVISAVAILVGIILAAFPWLQLLVIAPWLLATISATAAAGVAFLMGVVLDLRDQQYEFTLNQAKTFAEEA